jgi:glycine hydroxymethyltransferase
MPQDRQALRTVDPRVADVLRAEEDRHTSRLAMVASENYASPAVLEALGSVLTDRYASGYPGLRHYPDCQNVDAMECLAIERAGSLFGAERANVQPYSGSSANLAVFYAMLEAGDTVLSLDFSQGGHSTHGAIENYSGRYCVAETYGLSPETGMIDYEGLERLALERRPRLIIAGSSCYPRTMDWERFRRIADESGALLLVDMAHIAGLVAAGAHPSPVPMADFATGTTHKTLRGPRGGFILSRKSFGDAIDRAVFPGLQGGPLLHSIAASAVAFGEASTVGFRNYARRTIANAQAFALAMKNRGIVPVTGGTDTHLIWLGLKGSSGTGKSAEDALAQAGISCNAYPTPDGADGLRFGTAALTTRGMRESEMRTIAGWIADLVESRGEKSVVDRVKSAVCEMVAGYPRHIPVAEME